MSKNRRVSLNQVIQFTFQVEKTLNAMSAKLEAIERALGSDSIIEAMAEIKQEGIDRQNAAIDAHVEKGLAEGWLKLLVGEDVSLCDSLLVWEIPGQGRMFAIPNTTPIPKAFMGKRAEDALTVKDDQGRDVKGVVHAVYSYDRQLQQTKAAEEQAAIAEGVRKFREAKAADEKANGALKAVTEPDWIEKDEDQVPKVVN